MTSVVGIIDTKAHWVSCVRTVQYDAGQSLGAKIDPNQQDRASQQIDSHYRPVILKYVDKRVDNSWNVDLSKKTTIVQASPRPPESDQKTTKEEEDKKRAQRAQVVGTASAGIAALFLGYFCTEYSRQEETLRETVRAQKNISLVKEIVGNTPLKSALESLIETQLKIDKLTISKSKAYFWSAASVVVSGGVLAWGGFSAAQRLITLGEAALVASVVFTFYNIGAHLNDHKELRKYYIAILGDSTNRVKGQADYALEELNKVDEKLIILSDAPPSYESLYPESYGANWAQPSAPPPYQE